MCEEPAFLKELRALRRDLEKKKEKPRKPKKGAESGEKIGTREVNRHVK